MSEAKSKLTTGPVPLWWGLVSAALIAYAMGYWMWNVPLADSVGSLEAPIDIAELSDDEVLALAADSSTVAMGRDLYSQNCAKCHGKRAEGFSGPNLTDNFWIEGGRPSDTFKTIVYGRFGKMPPWGRVLGETECQALAAYVESLRGTNESGKPPQGKEVLLGKEAKEDEEVETP